MNLYPVVKRTAAKVKQQALNYCDVMLRLSCCFVVWLLLSSLTPILPVQADDHTAPSLLLTGQAVQGGLLRGAVPAGTIAELDNSTLSVSAEGLFIIGFHRDETATRLLRLHYPDGSQSSHLLTPTERQWQIQRINGLSGKYVSPPDEVIARIRRDQDDVRIARQGLDFTPEFLRGGFIWPVAGPITGVYGAQRILNGKPRQPHYGVDIAAATGTPIKASAAGIITLAKDLYYTGGTIIIDHGFGLTTTYSHLHQIAVSAGQQVKAGAVIGTVGSTGRSTGAHLDWRVNLGPRRLDPQLVAALLDPQS